MSNEITVTARLRADKGFLSVDRNPGAQSVTMTGTRKVSGTADVLHTAHGALTVPAAFGTSGWAYFRNLDTTNFVQVGLDVAAAFVPFVKLMPGEACVVPLSTDAVYAKADTATVLLEYEILER